MPRFFARENSNLRRQTEWVSAGMTSFPIGLRVPLTSGTVVVGKVDLSPLPQSALRRGFIIT
jgi:hypothetical protein